MSPDETWRLTKDMIIARLPSKGGTEANFARLYLKHPNDKEMIAKMQHAFDTSDAQNSAVDRAKILCSYASLRVPYDGDFDVLYVAFGSGA